MRAEQPWPNGDARRAAWYQTAQARRALCRTDTHVAVSQPEDSNSDDTQAQAQSCAHNFSSPPSNTYKNELRRTRFYFDLASWTATKFAGHCCVSAVMRNYPRQRTGTPRHQAPPSTQATATSTRTRAQRQHDSSSLSPPPARSHKSKTKTRSTISHHASTSRLGGALHASANVRPANRFTQHTLRHPSAGGYSTRAPASTLDASAAGRHDGRQQKMSQQ